jgi:predicted dinucleotide-binding enzyme
MVQETIAIAGAERKSGSIIAQKLVRLNQHRLLLLSEDEDQLKDLPEWLQQKSASGPEQINCLKDGCWEADIIILDVPFSSYAEVAEKIREVSTQKIVFVLSGDGQDPLPTISRVEEWQDLLPNAKLVFALNPLSSSGTMLSGADGESLNIIAEILKKLGLEPIIKIKNKN